MWPASTKFLWRRLISTAQLTRRRSVASLKALIPRRISADGGAEEAYSSPETCQSSFRLSRRLVLIPCKNSLGYTAVGTPSLRVDSREIKLSEAGVSSEGPYLILALRDKGSDHGLQANSRTLSIEDIVLPFSCSRRSTVPAANITGRMVAFSLIFSRDQPALIISSDHVSLFLDDKPFQGNTDLVNLNSTGNRQFRQFSRVPHCTLA